MKVILSILLYCILAIASMPAYAAPQAIYTQDYLGINRAVINGSSGAIEQTTAYYPYGGIIADLGTPATGQPYRFGDRECERFFAPLRPTIELLVIRCL